MDRKKIKILSLASTYPESVDSKRPKFVHLLNKELVKLGVYVKAIVPHSKDSMTKEIMDSVTVKRFRYLSGKYELQDLSIPEEIKKSKFGKLKIIFLTLSFLGFTILECLKERPEIIHGQWAFPAGFLAYVVSKIFSTKCVITIHGAETPLLKKYPFILKQTINSLNQCSLVIVNSDYTKNEYIKMGVNENKFVQINPIPNFVSHISDNEILKKFRRKITEDDSKIILFVGRLVERKGVEYLIKSLPEIKNKNLHLLIAGEGIILKELKKITTSLKLEDKTTFFGSPTYEELGLLYDVSDVFVLPSIIDSKGETEGLGLVIPEAMESGLPVIATSVGGIPNIIKNEINGLLVQPNDPKALAEAINKTLSNKLFTEKIIQNSKKTVSDFNPETIAKMHLSHYERILKN